MDIQNIPLCKHGVTDQDYECLECKAEESQETKRQINGAKWGQCIFDHDHTEHTKDCVIHN